MCRHCDSTKHRHSRDSNVGTDVLGHVEWYVDRHILAKVGGDQATMEVERRGLEESAGGDTRGECEVEGNEEDNACGGAHFGGVKYTLEM